ncbi:MAG: U32 family peptidase [Bacilli bacterium]
MTKLMVIPSINYKKLEQADAYLFGIENMSVNFEHYIKMEQLKEISEYLNKKNKECFIALNKNFHNKDLDQLEQILLEIENLNITGIFYYDLALLSLKDKLKLKINLVWSAEHLTTNYATINFYQKYGVEYTYLSGEITKDEIIEIRKNTKNKLIVPILGYLPMFVSERHLVDNYLKTFNLSTKSKINYIRHNNKNYPIIDNDQTTTIYSASILNGFDEYLELKNNKIDYVTLNAFNIEDELFKKILELYKNGTNEEQLNILLNDNTDKGFLYKETIYKVKNND